MSNKRKRKLSIICATLFCALVITAYAHSGRTDANGGHWNHSTGEYHYHTGEYAGKNSSKKSSSSTSKYKASTKSKSANKVTTKSTDNKTPEKKNDEITFWDVAKFILGVHIALFPILIELYSSIFQSITNFFRNRKRK